MNIWHTSLPTNQDFPVWAYLGDDAEDVVLCRYMSDIPNNTRVTWCKANIPNPPKDHVRHKYEVLSQNSIGAIRTAYDWFRAGYNYGKYCKGTCGCDKGQAIKSAQSPFVSPEEFWDKVVEDLGMREPNESAYDEKV